MDLKIKEMSLPPSKEKKQFIQKSKLINLELLQAITRSQVNTTANTQSSSSDQDRSHKKQLGHLVMQAKEWGKMMM